MLYKCHVVLILQSSSLWKLDYEKRQKKQNSVKKDIKKQIPDPPSSWTLILCICKFVGTNSNFLSAFKLLALNEGPEKCRRKVSIKTLHLPMLKYSRGFIHHWLHAESKAEENKYKKMCLSVSVYNSIL